jgi:hypothetical protein
MLNPGERIGFAELSAKCRIVSPFLAAKSFNFLPVTLIAEKPAALHYLQQLLYNVFLQYQSEQSSWHPQ